MNYISTHLASFITAMAVLSAGSLFAAPPDLTKSNSVNRTATYNLGATGMRGWIYTHALTPADAAFGRTTGESRQILVTHVGTNSPAYGVMQVDDVILGIDDKPFTDDARKGIALAIQEAEKSPVGGETGTQKKTSSGSLVLLRWRAGKTESVALKMRVMGTYSDTAPYKCPKSAKILEEALPALQKETDMWKSVSGLAMLASGDPRYMPQIKAIAQEVGPATLKYDMPSIGMGVWKMGYLGIFLAEYYLQTGDTSVEHALKEVSVTLAKGQSMFGTFGHGISALTKEGKFHGSIMPYGAINMNAASANLAIFLSKRCGVKDPEIDAAVVRANGYFGYFVDKGYLNYGEHEPAYGPNMGHANNGSGPAVAVLFGVQSDRIRETQYWSRMSVASYPNTEMGHCGQGLSYFWRMLGANMGGPQAAAAFFKEMSWHFDLARRCDGTFTYDGAEQFGPGRTDDNTYYGRSTWNGVSPTAYHILSYAVALKQLCITGKEMKASTWLTRQEVADAIAAGRFEQDQKNLSVEALTKALGNWSPTVRCRAAWELAKHPEARSLVPQWITAAEGPDAWLRKGACEALSQFKAPEALPVFIRLLHHEDRGLRWLAAQALGNFDTDAVAPYSETLLQALITNAQPNDPIDWNDPLQFANYALSKTLFNGKIIAATAKARKDLLLPALRVAMQLPTGYARGQISNFLRSQLTAGDVTALTSDLVELASAMSPADTMFRAGARMASIETLAKHRLMEGIPVALELQKVDCHSCGNEHSAGLSALAQYGEAARWTLPALRQLAFDRAPENLPVSVGNVLQTIEAIAAATNSLPLISGLPAAHSQVVATTAATAIELKGQDPLGEPLTWTITTPPAHGTITGVPPKLVYKPKSGFSGVDRLLFRVATRRANSAPGTVSFIVGQAGQGLKADYFRASDLRKPAVTRIEAVDGNWGAGAPDPALTPTNFIVRWQGQVLIPETGTYVFSMLNADSVMLRINGVQVINKPRQAPLRWTDGAAIDLQAGQLCDLTLVCSKKTTGPGTVRLKWTGPSFAGDNGVTVGKEWLFADSPAGAAKPPKLAQLVKTANTQPVMITLDDGDINEPSAWQITLPPKHGTLLGAAPTLTYTPAVGFVGEDRFVCQLTGGKKQSTPTTIGIIVTAAPAAPSERPAVADPIPADAARVGPGTSVEIKKDADIAGGTLVLNGGTLNLQGGLSAASTLVLAADTVSTIDSTVKGNGADLHATILGSGKLILSGTSSNLRIGYASKINTYKGDTRIALSGGTLLELSGTPFGTVGRVTFAGQGGPVAMCMRGWGVIMPNIHLESSVVCSQPDSGTGFVPLRLTGNISGPGGLTKTFDAKDRGTFVRLSGRGSTFSGGIDFRSGYLQVLTPTSMGSGAVTLGGKATAAHVVGFVTLVPLTVHNPITLIGIPDGATPQPAAMTEFQVVPTLEIAGPLAGTGGLLKTGSGVMVLSGVSSLTGPITVQAGTLAIARTAAFGRGSVEIAEGAKLQLDYAGSHSLPAMRIAGKDLPAGTYGGKDSIATSKMPAYFTGPGMVTIGDAKSPSLSTALDVESRPK